MKKLSQKTIFIFSLIIPLLTFKFCSYFFAEDIYWYSPTIYGNYGRLGLFYPGILVLFCIILYILILVAMLKKRVKLLIIPSLLIIVFLALNILTIQYYKNKKIKQGMNRYDEQLKTNSEDSVALENKAQLYAQKGQYDKAIQIFTEALEITKNPSYVVHDRGLAYMRKGASEKAIIDFNRAMELNPDEKDFIAQCYNDRGNAYYDKGEYDKSWQDVQRAVEMGYSVHPGFIASLKSKGYSK